ncbi:MAG: DUF2061 domain-containing protein [Verrucomicrobia bacterium]|nr:DUF2061 domain-containing protein [Verrucomicrobiota bacterium]
MERSHRSLAKAVSYRITGTLATVLVSWLVTGQIQAALSIGFVELFAKTGLYYLHERAWNRIGLGRLQPPEDFQI